MTVTATAPTRSASLSALDTFKHRDVSSTLNLVLNMNTKAASFVAVWRVCGSYMSPRVNVSGAGESKRGPSVFLSDCFLDSSMALANSSRSPGACSAMACSTGMYSSPVHRDHGLSAAASTGIWPLPLPTSTNAPGSPPPSPSSSGSHASTTATKNPMSNSPYLNSSSSSACLMYSPLASNASAEDMTRS